MSKRPIGGLAAATFCLVFACAAQAECRSADNPADACRYPTGDAWCARHGDGSLFAYKDDCGKDREQPATPARPPAAAGGWSPVPAWDCDKARTGTERLICSNPDIHAQDAKMGTLYARLQARGQAPERQQKAWLVERRGACDSADCLRAVYAERIRELERLASAGAAPVEDHSYLMSGTAPPASPPAQSRTLPPEPVAETAAAANPEPVPTPDAASPSPQTGIPELPPPEGPTLDAARRAAAAGAAAFGEGGKPPSRGSGLVSAAVAALALSLGLLLWRRRARVQAAVAPSRERFARLGERMRMAPSAGLAGLRDLRERAQASARRGGTPTGESGTPGADLPGRSELRLPDETIARLRAQARPGESLSAVVARAVAALEAASTRPPSDAVLSRLSALEARLAQLEGTEAGDRT